MKTPEALGKNGDYAPTESMVAAGREFMPRAVSEEQVVRAFIAMMQQGEIDGKVPPPSALAASKTPETPVGEDDELDLYDDKVQAGISWAMRQWGEALGLTTWTQGDGSESVEGDVGAEIHTILIDAGLRDPETNEMATLAAHQAGEKVSAPSRGGLDSLADELRERAVGFRRVHERFGEKLNCSTINGALEYGRAQGMEIAAEYIDNRLALSPNTTGKAPEAVGEGVSLRDCPPGLFRFGETLGFKSEYGAMEPIGSNFKTWKVGNGVEAFCADTGEIFWGGQTDRAKRDALIVVPVSSEALAAQPSAGGQAVAWAIVTEGGLWIATTDKDVAERWTLLYEHDVKSLGVIATPAQPDSGVVEALREALQAAYEMPRGKRWLPELAEDRKAIRRIQNSPEIMAAILAALSTSEGGGR